MVTPEYKVSARLAADLAAVGGTLGLCEVVEARALRGELHAALKYLDTWSAFSAEVSDALRTRHHIVIRGIPNDPVTLLLVATTTGQRFRAYRSTKIVKAFTLSPWTRSLSHTIAEGHFHTDLNTKPEPPHTTAIQCVVPDPNSPEHGEVRVASLQDVLSGLARDGHRKTLRFLCENEAVMVSDSEPVAWRGRIVTDGVIRFHPETLRAAQRRFPGCNAQLEEHLALVKAAALAVSEPIQLGAGDILFVSNHHALHYRGACTVRFHTYPREFESRSVHVLHLMEGP